MLRDLLLREAPFTILLFLVLLFMVFATANIIIGVRILRAVKTLLQGSRERILYLADENQRLELLREEHGLLREMLEQKRNELLAAQQRLRVLENVQHSKTDEQLASLHSGLQEIRERLAQAPIGASLEGESSNGQSRRTTSTDKKR